MPDTRVSLLAVTVDGKPADIRLDTDSSSEPILRLGPGGIALHLAASAETLDEIAKQLTLAARLKDRRGWRFPKSEVA